MISDSIAWLIGRSISKPLGQLGHRMQALADGKMGTDGVFHATQIQAKCASKYESKPGLKPGQAPPNTYYNTPAKSI